MRELAAQVDGANTVEGTWMSDFALHFFPCYVTVGETYATWKKLSLAIFWWCYEFCNLVRTNSQKEKFDKPLFREPTFYIYIFLFL